MPTSTLAVTLWSACTEYRPSAILPPSDAGEMSADNFDDMCLPSGEDHSPLATDGTPAWEDSIDQARQIFRSEVARHGLDQDSFTLLTVTDVSVRDDGFYQEQGQLLKVAGDQREDLWKAYQESESDTSSYFDGFYDKVALPTGLPVEVCNSWREQGDYFDLFLMTQFYVGSQIPSNALAGVADGIYASYLYADSEGSQDYFFVAVDDDGLYVTEKWDSLAAEAARQGPLGNAAQAQENTVDSLNETADALSIGWEETDASKSLSYGLWYCHAGTCN